MQTKVIKLGEGETKAEITMRCPTVLNMKLAMKKASDIEQTIYLVSAVCNMTEQEVEALPLPDFITLQEGLASFLGKRD